MAAGTQPSDTSQDWKKKYLDSLDTLENEQKKFQAVEAVLKRVVGRLCIASRGQSAKLDGELSKLQTLMRRDTTVEELEKNSSSLTDAINSLDQPQTSTGGVLPAKSYAELTDGSVVGDERIRAVLATLIADLRRDPELIMQVDALDAKLAKEMKRDQLSEVLTSFVELIGKRISRIERAKQEIEGLLSQLMGRLDEMTQFVAAQNQNQSQSLASSESLNTQLVGEMKAMGETVESAVELQQVRSQVRHRLDSIGRYLQEFRARESIRADEMRSRNDKMQARVNELEAETNRLQNRLKDEQRQSTLDVLTKIPNRLAYEKRMEEELKRFQRFKQPTCLAVWDVDRFKTINDTYGHAAGDKVLAAVAQCLAGRIRGTDFLARFGGEEFVMILCGAKIEDALRLMDGMRIGVSDLKLHSRGTPISITISSGVTALAANDSASAAFERADKAMYKAKEAGRNKCLSG